MNFELKAQKPFSFYSTITAHGWIQLAPFSHNDDYSSIKYVSALKSGRVIEPELTGSPDGVRVYVKGKLNKSETSELAESVNWMFRLNNNYSKFYKYAREEPKLSHVRRKKLGRMLRSSSIFEDIVKTILTTNTAWSGTIRMVESLVSALGNPLPENPEKKAFPLPKQIAAAGIEYLSKEVKLGYRAPYIHKLAAGVSSGERNLEELKDPGLPAVELRKKLLSIKGIGSYAAASLLMILDRYDFVPIDSWAFKVVSTEWFDGKAVGPKEVERVFKDWGEWKGLAYWFWDWAYKHEAEISESKEAR